MGRKVIVSLFTLLIGTGCYDSFDDGAPLEQSTPLANCTIATLHEKYALGTRDISLPLQIVGYVTTNDESGNFFKTFSIESEGYAVEVLDGLYDSYTRYPLGAAVLIEAEGLRMDRYMGVLRLGLPAPDYDIYTLDYMESEAIVDQYITVYANSKTVEPTIYSIEDLSQDKCGSFVEIEGVSYTSEDGVESSWEGYKLFTNAQCDSVWCYTSSYAAFAREIIPMGEISLVGMLQFGSTDSGTNRFIIKLRDV